MKKTYKNKLETIYRTERNCVSGENGNLQVNNYQKFGLLRAPSMSAHVIRKRQRKGTPWQIPNPTLFQVLRILRLLIQIRLQLSVLEVVGLLQLNHSNTSNPSDVPVGLVILAIIVITQQDRSPCSHNMF